MNGLLPPPGPTPHIERIRMHATCGWTERDTASCAPHIERLQREHGCEVEFSYAAATGALTVTDWSDPGTDPLAWDEHMHRLEDSHHSFVLALACALPQHAARVLGQTSLRYQRLLPYGPSYDLPRELPGILELHRRLHDLSRPLVRADFDHSLDTWRWLLRSTPGADLALQCAALFHDVERLESEADARREQHAPDYEQFKQAHARRGAELLGERLAASSLDEATIRETCRLVSQHERPNDDERLQLLNDADGLSFFSLNSYGYLRYFGAEPTRAKVRYTLARLSPPARQQALTLDHHPLVRELLN